VCNPWCFSRAASAARAGTVVSTYHMVQDRSREPCRCCGTRAGAAWFSVLLENQHFRPKELSMMTTLFDADIELALLNES
jgi:hypothetical protein